MHILHLQSWMLYNSLPDWEYSLFCEHGYSAVEHNLWFKFLDSKWDVLLLYSSLRHALGESHNWQAYLNIYIQVLAFQLSKFQPMDKEKGFIMSNAIKTL